MKRKVFISLDAAFNMVRAGLQTSTSMSLETWQGLLKLQFNQFLGISCYLAKSWQRHFSYRKVASSRPVYYSILNFFGQRSHYPFINSLKILECSTNRDSLLLATLRYMKIILRCLAYISFMESINVLSNNVRQERKY